MNFFKAPQPFPQVSDEITLWLESAFVWLINEFGEQKFLETEAFSPAKLNAAFQPSNYENAVNEYLASVANQMEVDPNEIRINFTEQRMLDIHGDPVYPFVATMHDNESLTRALLTEKNTEGYFTINIEKSDLLYPQKLISSIAHEIAQIKMIGEGRLINNDEYLNDLVTVFFGLGVFSANNTFIFSSNLDSWTYNRKGYFTQQEWGYILALYAFMRKEKSPKWAKHLSADIKPDFKKATAYFKHTLAKK